MGKKTQPRDPTSKRSRRRKRLERPGPEAPEHLAKEFQTETDRGAVLVAAAIVDRHLGVLLKEHFLAVSTFTEDEVAGILNKSSSSLLLNFRARATVAHAFGLIPRFLYDAIDALGDLRNEYAHEEEVSPLLDEDVDEIANHLDRRSLFVLGQSLTRVGIPKSPKVQLAFVAIAMIAAIETVSLGIEPAKTTSR